MKSASITLLTFLLCLPASAALYDSDLIYLLYDKESKGIRAYQNTDYESAFKLLSDTATKGLKESQYLVALMFIKGEGVNKSVLIGLGWLGVAKESGNEEWISTFDNIYAALTDSQRGMVDEQVRRYTEKYGQDTQGVTCSNRPPAGSRKVQLRCEKSAGNYPDYEIELVP